MKKRMQQLAGGLALGLAVCGMAYAQDDDRQQNQRNWERQHGISNGQWDAPRGAYARPPEGDRWHQDRDGDRRYDGRYDRDGDRRGWGAGPERAWHRGDRLPNEYRQRYYVVDDWRGHRLAPPPRGYQWVQYGGDYLLVAIATGVIAQLVLANR